MASRKILEIPKLIDLALGTPDIRVVNFSLLHALLHVMVKEIFDLEQMQIELIQKIDGKFEAILHRGSVNSQDITNNITNVILNVENETLKLADEKLLTKSYETKSDINDGKAKILQKNKRNNHSKADVAKSTLLVWDKNISKQKKTKKVKSTKSFLDIKTEGLSKEIMLETSLDNLVECPFDVSGTPSNESTESQNMVKAKSSASLDNRLGEVDELERQFAGEDTGDIKHFISNHQRGPSAGNSSINLGFSNSSLRNTKNILQQIEEQEDNKSSKSGRSNKDIERQRAGQDDDIAGNSCEKRLRAGKGSDDDIRDSEIHLIKAVDSMQILTRQLEHRMGEVEDSVKNVRKTLMNFNYEMNKNLESFNAIIETMKSPSSMNELESIAGLPLKTPELTAILKDVKHLKHDACDFKKQMKAVLNHIMTNIKIHKELEKKIIYPTEQARHQHEYFDAKFQEMQDKYRDTNKQIIVLEKQLCVLNKEIDELLVSKREATTSSLNLMDLHLELNEVKKYSTSVMKELEKVQQERLAYKLLMESIKKDIETLFASKLDKEEIDELLTEKADCALLDQKLSLDEYNISRKRLENFVKNGLDRVSELESSLKSKINSFGELLANKLDASALKLFRDEIDKKLHILNDKMAGMKTSGAGGGASTAAPEVGREPEAAATKSSLLTNVECLSCQKSVVMKMKQNEKVSLLSSCHVTKSLKPQLTYQLDLLRHDQKDLPFSRNLHHFESMMKKIKMTGKQKRYCGGSHTLVTNETKIAAGSNKSGVREGAKNIANMKCIS